MEQLGFSPVSVKQTKWLVLRLVKYTSVKLIGWSSVTGIVLSSCQLFKKNIFGKSWFYMK